MIAIMLFGTLTAFAEAIDNTVQNETGALEQMENKEVIADEYLENDEDKVASEAEENPSEETGRMLDGVPVASVKGMQLMAAGTSNATVTNGVAKKVTFEYYDSVYGKTYTICTEKGITEQTLSFCARHDKNTPPAGTKFNNIIYYSPTSTDSTVKMVRKILWYGYGGPKNELGTGNKNYLKTELALSYARGYEDGVPVGALKTETKNWINSLKSKAAPPSNFYVYRGVCGGDLQDLAFWKFNPSGKLRIRKTANPSSATAAMGYVLTGAEYGVYASKTGSRLATLKTTSTGYTSYTSFDLGGKLEKTFYIKELKAPKNFKLREGWFSITIKNQGEHTATLYNSIEYPKMKLIKESTDTALTDANDIYNFNGAEFKVYTNKACTGTPVGKFTTKQTTDAAGHKIGVSTNTISNLLPGTYWVKETKAPSFMEISDEIKEVRLTTDYIDTPQLVEFEDVPNPLDPFYILKLDKDTGLSKAQGKGSLENAIFEITWTKDGSTPALVDSVDTIVWRYKTDINGQISFEREDQCIYSSFEALGGDKFPWRTPNGNPSLIKGAMTVREITPPLGYLLNPETKSFSIGDTTETTYARIEDEIIKGDISFKKINQKTRLPMDGIKFDIISKTTGDVVMTLTTDENGEATTVSEERPNGSLPYDDYILREAEVPIGYLPLEDYEFSIETDKQHIEDLVFENIPAEIKTNAHALDTGLNLTMPSEQVTIIDVVSYKNLIIGDEYTLKGVLMNKETGEPLLDENGDPYTAEKTFEAPSKDGTIELEYTIDARSLAGKSIVVFEDLYTQDVKVATHSDLEDAEQTITFLDPKISTTLVDNMGRKASVGKKNTALKDKVEYTGLLAGFDYILIGVLYDAETGQMLDIGNTSYVDDADIGDTSLTDAERYALIDKPVIAEKRFTAINETGEETVEFSFDAHKLNGRKIVCYEYLYMVAKDRNGEDAEKLIAEHTDLTDEGQTIDFVNPKIGTSATDEIGRKITVAKKNTVLIDTVKYTGLAEGSEYMLIGMLYDAETGERLEIPLKAEKRFTPSAENGTVDVTFTFDGHKLFGKKVVCYEYLYIIDIDNEGKEESTLVAQHTDINDEKQMIDFAIPTIHTVATDEKGQKTTVAKKVTTIVDTVSYTGLSKDIKYVLTGELYDVEAGIEAGPVATARKVFTPSSEDGTASVVFTFDAEGLDGKKLVCFEHLYIESTNELVAEHTDINDTEQTISFFNIGTIDIDDNVLYRQDGKLILPVPLTGDENELMLFILLLISATSIAGIMLIQGIEKARRKE